MRRREFIAGLSSVAVLPTGAMAQKSSTPVIGYMHAGTAAGNYDLVQAFEQGLGQSGYVNGQNVKVEYQFAQGQYDKLPPIAAEFVSRPVSVIVAGTPIAALAAKQATKHIPIVFAIGSDPIKDGLVTSFSRPGGNITGSTFFSDLLTAKRLGLLHELVPNASLFAALVNPNNSNAELETMDVKAAAHTLGVQLIFSNAATEAEIQELLQTFGERRAHSLIVLSDAFLNARARQIAYLALRYKLPTCFAFREPAVAGRTDELWG